MSADTPPPTYRRGLRGFEPANASAEQFWRETKIGQVVKLEGKRPRNLARHNLYWKACTVAADNMEEYASAQTLHQSTKIALGIYTALPVIGTGKIAVEAGSTAFDKMAEAEFRDFFDKAMTLWSDRLGVPIETLLQEAQAA